MLSNMTKATIIEWASTEDREAETVEEEDFRFARIDKIFDMMKKGQTDGGHEYINDTTAKRLWKDESSAQEFIDFVTALSSVHNKTIVSATIVDI